MEKDSAEQKTLDYLFRIQQTFSQTRTLNDIADSSNKRIAAYLGWHLHNKLDQCEQDIGLLRKSNARADKLPELTELCSNCFSVLTHYRTIPKKLKHKKKQKKGSNYSSNALSARCEFCKSHFKFAGLKKDSVSLTATKKRHNLNTTANTSRSSITNHKSNLSAQPTTPIKPPTNTKSNQKEILQKLLSDSKKKRSLDNKTRLSDFLSSCFTK